MGLQAAALLLLFSAFPFFWDTGSEAMENVALWILNPLYSFDYDDPCPADWTDDMIHDAYRDSKYSKDFFVLWVDRDTAEIVCRPDLKSQYLLTQITANTELKEDLPENVMDIVVEMVTNISTALTTSLTLGIAKAVISIQLVIMAVTVGVVLDVFVGITIAAMPLFAVMAMIPMAGKVATTFLSLIPAMLLIPILTAILIVVGAGFVAGVPDHYEDVGDGAFSLHLVFAWIASLRHHIPRDHAACHAHQAPI